MYAWRGYNNDNKKVQNEDDPGVPKPALNVDTIRRLAKIPGIHICVIFDEIDKFGVTDKRLVELFEITNALSEVKAQMIATSNHSPEQLIQRWNSPHSDAILRRFFDSTGEEPRHELVCTAELVKKPGKDSQNSGGKVSKQTAPGAGSKTAETTATPPDKKQGKPPDAKSPKMPKPPGVEHRPPAQ
jgi:hypothetical protein